MGLYGLRIEMRKTGGYDEPRIRHNDGERARRVQRINQKRAMPFAAKIEKLNVGRISKKASTTRRKVANNHGSVWRDQKTSTGVIKKARDNAAK